MSVRDERLERIIELILSADSHEPDDLCNSIAELQFGPGKAATVQAGRYLQALQDHELTKQVAHDNKPGDQLIVFGCYWEPVQTAQLLRVILANLGRPFPDIRSALNLLRGSRFADELDLTTRPNSSKAQNIRQKREASLSALLDRELVPEDQRSELKRITRFDSKAKVLAELKRFAPKLWSIGLGTFENFWADQKVAKISRNKGG